MTKRYGWLVLGISVAAFALGSGLTFVIAREHRWGIGLWLSDFAKSSGFAGLCALAAATIAFTGISRQVRVSREALAHAEKQALKSRRHTQQVFEHAQRADADRAWWQSFQWASSRAIPENPSETALPLVSVVRALEALARSASNEVQRGAISGVMDAATDLSKSRSINAQSADEPDPDSDAGIQEALEAFVTTTANTSASSTGAEARLYEIDVMSAIRRLSGPSAVRTAPALRVESGLLAGDVIRPDAVVTSHGQEVIIEVKYLRKSSSMLARRVRETVARLSEFQRPILIVTPSESDSQARRTGRPKVAVVQWRDANDDDALRLALDRLTQRA
ncbi:hypothetical protein [Microbacterium sp.]|uniref:hypothetical protein n=1 Tax=Microbacterium sp. TaxID=51671 RepID=UPI0028128106|nr:hypothetical protein [Microbacterium sp.]